MSQTRKSIVDFHQFWEELNCEKKMVSNGFSNFKLLGTGLENEHVLPNVKIT